MITRIALLPTFPINDALMEMVPNKPRHLFLFQRFEMADEGSTRMFFSFIDRACQ